MTDAELISRVLDGDADAFAVIVSRHADACARFARRMLGNQLDAEDAVQETFLRVHRSLGRYREEGRFRPWLFRILANQCRTFAVQRQRNRHLEIADPRALDRAAVESQERRFEHADGLQAALATLDPVLREAFVLKYGLELEYAEMTEITGAGISALKMRVKRACDALRPRLGALLDGS
jgi:RNA polymerase sigma-70 factor, ECF subfamily